MKTTSGLWLAAALAGLLLPQFTPPGRAQTNLPAGPYGQEAPAVPGAVPAEAVVLPVVEVPSSPLLPGGTLTNRVPGASGAAAVRPNGGVAPVRRAVATGVPVVPEEVIPEIVLEDAPLPEAIRLLGLAAGMEATIDPQLFTAGPNTPAPAVPLVTLVLTNVTARQALEKLLEDHHLTLISDPATQTHLVTDVPIDLTAPETAAAAIPISEGDQVQAVINVGEIALLEAIDMLVTSAEIDVLIDPSLLPLPGITNAIPTNNLPAMRFYNKTYRQVLDALLENNKLVLLPDPKTGISRITRKPAPGLEPLYTEIIQLKNSAVTNIVTAIQTILGTPSRSKVTADHRTSQLILVATRSDLDTITNLVALLDQPTRQVLIEAKLLQTTKNPRSVKGVDWSQSLSAQNVSFGSGLISGNSSSTRSSTRSSTTADELVPLPSGRQVLQPVTRSQSTRGSGSSSGTSTVFPGGNVPGFGFDTAGGMPETAFLNADGLRAVLSYLNTESDTKVLATPRAVTLDNEAARLSVTFGYPIFKNTAGSAQTPPSSEVTYTNVGTILEVTPRIAANSNIALKIAPEVSSVAGQDTQFINGQENSANIYLINRIETRVLVPNGHTLVLGGLISDESTKSYRKVPLLGDIPGLGLLFRHDTKSRTKGNLLVFVTPTIVGTDDFQPATTEFLQTKPPEETEIEESAWDRGKPHQWRKARDPKTKK